MKTKFRYSIHVLFLAAFLAMSSLGSSLKAQALPAGCCPEFKLVNQQVEMCDPRECEADQSPVGKPPKIACKNQIMHYVAVPNLPGFTYTWSVFGGTLQNTAGNQTDVLWGNASAGTIQVIIDNGLGCRDTIREKICLLDGPTAGITFSPNPVCVNTPINFLGATSVGAITYQWNFGDGTFSNLQNPPPHMYSTPGLKTIILTVGSQSGGTAGGNEPRDCGCKDTAMVVINVLAQAGLTIAPVDCKRMLCTGDTASYCVTPTSCGSYNWTVNGGTIIGSATGTCVQIRWNQPSVTPTSITVTGSGCPGSVCGNTATLNVPVLYPNLQIQSSHPNANVCPGSSVQYSLPALPGTFYNWTLSGGGTISSADSNHNIITVGWGLATGGPYTLICNYTNPYSGCSGADTITVNIKPRYKITGPTTVCLNQSMPVIYNASPNVNPASWAVTPTLGRTLGAPAGNSLPITWTLPGSYNITANVAAGSAANYCTSSALHTVLVKDTAIVGNISNPGTICANTNTMFSITSNQSGPFTWTITNGTIVQQYGANNDSVLVKFTSNGTLTVTQNYNGCPSSPKSINVNVISSIGAITGPSPACIDQVATYTIAGPVPPSGYTWSLSNGMGTIQSTTANTATILWNGPAAPGSGTCVITATACGVTSTLTVTVITPANGTITSTGTMCTPGVTLTASILASVSPYSWTLNGSPLAGTGNSILANAPGFYKVKPVNGCFGFATINVPNTFTSTVSISTGNLTTYCIGSAINTTFIATLQSNNACTYSYQWYHNGNPVGTNSTSYTATAAGAYAVVISCGACTAVSNIMNIALVNCDGCKAEVEKPIGWNMGGPSADELTYVEMEEYTTLAYSVSINAPVVSTPYCNQVSFNANYNFTAPNSNAYGSANWSFGDGNTQTTTAPGNVGLTSTSVHTYTTPGIYLVSVNMGANCPPPPYPRVCPLWDTLSYVVPIAANFNFNKVCKQVFLTDLSSTLPSLGCNIASWSWSVIAGPAGATFNNPSTANPILTTLAPGVYSVQLVVTSTCGGCQAKLVRNITITAPNATINAVSPVCAKTAAPFVPAQVNTPGFTYNWNFGDGYQSNLYNGTHTFASAGNYLVTLTIADTAGCTAVDTMTVSVKPPIVVTIPTIPFICPGTSHTINATVVSGPGGPYTNQWFFNGNPTGVNSASHVASVQGSYYVQVSNGVGCVSKSNTSSLWFSPKPIANIVGNSLACMVGGSATFNLNNSVTNPNYTYLWTASPAATFSPSNNVNFVNVTVNSTGVYQFILLVTDTATGCIARDTFCVWANPSPTVSVVPPGYLCSGVAHTLTASPILSGHIYSWSNGVIGTSMITGAAGWYSVTAFNPSTGCSAQSNMVEIKKRPYLALFPIGCDTLCDTAKIIPPIPIKNWQNYAGVYNIQWYVDGNPVGNFPILNANTLSPGAHSIYIVVNFLGDTCKSTSGVYNVFIKNCDCNCEGSSWGEIVMQKGGDAASNNKTGNTKTANLNIRSSQANSTTKTTVNTVATLLECKTSYNVDCNVPITINASYNCADTSCPPLVTYKLQPPTGAALTGNMALNFTPNQTGTYSLTMYGWCGGVICDSCTVFFKANCDSVPPPDCCKGSVWAVAPHYSLGENKKIIDCKNPVSIIISGANCNLPLVVNAAIQCPPNCTSSTVITVYDNLSNIVQQGPAPQNLSALPNGIYNVVIIGYCNGVPCLKCEFGIKKDCQQKPCDCKGSTWGTIGLSESGIAVPVEDKEANKSAIAIGNLPPVSIKLLCNKNYNLKCNKTYSVNASYNCVDATCPPKVTYSLTYPNATVSTGIAPFSFTTSQSGMYTLTLYGWCGTKICDSCKITFKVDCPPIENCCPYQIKVTPAQPTYVYNTATTTVSNNFAFVIPAAMSITEVRANIVSYTISDNFGGDCMKCVNLPYTWGSFASASNIGTAGPKITMYGGATVPAFNGTGAGAYQNPREIIWNNNTNLNAPPLANIAMSFILPSAPNITCCDLKGKICVKFIFRDQNCVECEVVGCFDFVVKKP